MANGKVPSWATGKQREGMELFMGINDEYTNFSIEFSQPERSPREDDDSEFRATVTWGFSGDGRKGVRAYTFDVGFDVIQVWSGSGERVHEWQFDFGDDCAREMTTEIFFISLFGYLDGIADTEPKASQQ